MNQTSNIEGLDSSNSDKKDRKKTFILIWISVFVVVIIIGMSLGFMFKGAAFKKQILPFKLFVDDDFEFNEGASANIVLTYEPMNAKIASISWFKINKEEDKTDHIVTFNTGLITTNKEAKRTRMKAIGSGNVYSGPMDGSSNDLVRPYFILDNNYDEIKDNNQSTSAHKQQGYDYIPYETSGTLKKSDNKDLNRYAVEFGEPGSFKLTIDDLIPYDAGLYKLTVLMKNDETHVKSFMLSVEPKLVAHVRNVQVEEASESSSIVCEIFPKTSAIRTTTWFRKFDNYTEAIASSNDDYVQRTPKYEAIIDEEKGRGLLIIRDVKVDDGGKYACFVNSEEEEYDSGAAASGMGTLTVNCNLTVHVYNQTAMVGDRSTYIECRILPPGEEITGVMWYRNNQHGKFNGTVIASTTDVTKPGSKYYTELEDNGRCTLFINDVSKADDGKYVCKVMRAFQMKLFKGSATLTVKSNYGVKTML
ncbi:uncharacterized protein [Antedon mediterranea]|uniref:uncharacterized protein n=1 Tax=Antedon mediterranea TaxID=105859 RepID=UPI003AF9F3F2